MARQKINIGVTANDGTGDTLRAAGNKINQNFTELYGEQPQTIATSGEQISRGFRPTIFNGTSPITATLPDGSADNYDDSDAGERKTLINIGTHDCTVTPITFRNGTTLHLKPNAQVELTWLGSTGWLLNEGKIYDSSDALGRFFVK